MTIHKEGRRLLFFLFLTLLALNLVVFLLPGSVYIFRIVLIVTVVLYLLILQFFRSPNISPLLRSNIILAPADGKVVAIEETFEAEYLHEKRKQISIFMSPVNVHVNRMPVGGVIEFFKYHPGKYLVAWHPKSSLENERTTVVVRMENGLTILTRQIAGAVARRIKWYISEGQSIEQGEEFGFIKFGSRVDVFVPLNAQITVKIGDKTKAGLTSIAELK